MKDIPFDNQVALGLRATTAYAAIANAEREVREFESYCPNDIADEKERLFFIIEKAIYQLTGKYITIPVD